MGDVKEQRKGFLKWALGDDADGYVEIGAKNSRSGEWTETIFKFPEDLEAIGNYIDSRALTSNLYFCATILRDPRCVKSSVEASWVAWADLDACSPEHLLVPPTVVIQTSPKRWQAYWRFKTKQHATDVEEINKRIAYHHQEQGCDITGWPLTKRLRIPNSRNYKYMPALHDVFIDKEFTDLNRVYDIADFDVYPSQGHSLTLTETPMPTEFPETADEILDRVRMSVNPRVWTLVEQVPDKDWSSKLYQLEMLLYTVGLTPEEVFVVAKQAACNKYERDGKSDELLWKDVIRVREKHENQSLIEAEDEEEEGLGWYIKDEPLLTDEERDRTSNRTTIIEEYIKWGKSVGDAAPQYHEASAFMILSALLAGRVRLLTSYGAIVPNLWFMILADTTLTRKTTAMDMGMDLLAEIDSDCILATDGSIEGLMSSLSMRPGRPSIFLRDEFSGLLEMMTKRDHYAGMLEAFTKLYDGKFQKRVLRKEIIEVKEPVFILFAGGIKERIFSLLGPDVIGSGFVQRFCYITANSNVSSLRPLGPPTEKTTEDRDELVQRFRDIYNHYVVTSDDEEMVFTKEWRAQLTTDAWVRYNKIYDKMLKIATESSIADVLTPMMSRLCESGLKVALLIAAAERLDQNVVVHENDILHAFMYIERWKQHTLNVVSNAGKKASERELEHIYKHIQNNPGTLRSTVMQIFHLNAREADSILVTLNQRSLIRSEKTNKRGERLYPMRIKKKKEDVVNV